MKQVKLISLFIACMFVFFGCNSEQKTISYTLNNILLTAEAPLFEGSNTFQVEVDPKFSAFLEANGITEKQVKDISVSSVNINAVSPENFSNYENILLQFFSENVDMKEIALNSSIEENNATTLALEIAKDSDVKKFLMAKKLGIVLDANLAQDDSINYTVSVDINFSITHK